MKLLLRALLVGLAAVILGCGDSGELSTNYVPGVGQVIELPEGETLRGGLPTQVVLVAYADTPAPYPPEAGTTLVAELDRFVVRNSTGAAWIVGEVVQVTLPGRAADYLGDYRLPDKDHRLPDTRLQQDCLRAAPQPKFRLYILPAGGQGVYMGYQLGVGWLSAVTFSTDILVLPVPHEFGHMLGFGHAATGAMQVTSAPVDWSDWWDDAALTSVGWIPRGGHREIGGPP